MKERDISGISRAARFAIQPNMKGFCGEKSDQQILRDFVTQQCEDEILARNILQHHGFPHLNAFLKTISEMSGLDAFDAETVNSYWLGGDLIEKIGTNTRSLLARNYGEQFMKIYGDHLGKVLPEHIYLTHLSQVILIAATDHEPEKHLFMNHCMVAWGKILEIDTKNKVATISRDALKQKSEGGYEVISKVETALVDEDLTPDLKVGDEVAAHLGYLAERIGPKQAEDLKYWTRKVVEII